MLRRVLVRVPCLGVDLPLTELERALFDVFLELKLTQTLAGGVVVVNRGLTSEFQGSFPHPDGEARDLGRHPGEGRGVVVDPGAQIPLKPPERRGHRNNEVGRHVLENDGYASIELTAKLWNTPRPRNRAEAIQGDEDMLA